MSKNDAINIKKNSNLNEKGGSLQFFLLSIKMSETTYYQRNRVVILNRAKDYYKNDKERLSDNARDKYTNLSEEEQNKNRKYGRNKYHNMFEKRKQKLKEYQKEYQKNYCEANKSRKS